PNGAALRRVLGTAASPWDDLVAHIKETYPPVGETWNFAGPKYGWSLRLTKPERVILYLIPQEGRFLVGIVLGTKAVSAAHDAALPASVLKAIDEAPRYAEGTGLRLPVSEAGHLPPIRKLAALKMTLR
ncbi:MAG TPA: DUF3788 domain-containing protein, partial [Thermoanaerobaculia bacterium]